VVHGLRTDESTSISTGALTLAGGLGVTKNINGGGNLSIAKAITNIGDTSFTNGTFITEDYVSATGTATTLSTLSNLNSYFTVTNDPTYPFIAPNTSYNATTYNTSGSINNITSSNISTYFTMTNPGSYINGSTTTYAWTYNSTEGAYFAGNTSGTGNTSKYYVMYLTAK